MQCHSPGCDGEREAQRTSHSLIYRERTFVIHQVPADVCPDCGETFLTEETTMVIAGLLRRRGRGKRAGFEYE
jgi:YgiT-type zinc finger domain-containing protein